MLDKKQMMRLGLNECVKMLGSDFVNKYKDRCGCGCGMTADGMFLYYLGLTVTDRVYRMGDESPMDFYAFVSIDPKTGKIERDYDKSILPQ